MSARGRMVAFATLCALLVGAGAILIAVGPSGTPSEPAETTETTSSGPPEFSELEERAHRREERSELEIVRNGVAEHEEEPAEPAVYARTLRAAEPVARRFWSAYSLYEVGRLDEKVRRELTATAGADFAEQLLSAPPRVPAGGERPPRGQLEGRLQLIPGAEDIPQAEFSSIELVGGVRRPGEGSELLSISMELDGGRWSVTGLGR